MLPWLFFKPSYYVTFTTTKGMMHVFTRLSMDDQTYPFKHTTPLLIR